jgi:hypothetical protein
MRKPGSDAVTVRANDVALLDLGDEPHPRHQHRPTIRDLKVLLSRVAVVEIHLVRFENRTAVGTWHTPKVAQERQGCSLSSADPGDLGIAIPRVVGHVRGALARTGPT